MAVAVFSILFFIVSFRFVSLLLNRSVASFSLVRESRQGPSSFYLAPPGSRPLLFLLSIDWAPVYTDFLPRSPLSAEINLVFSRISGLLISPGLIYRREAPCILRAREPEPTSPNVSPRLPLWHLSSGPGKKRTRLSPGFPWFTAAADGIWLNDPGSSRSPLRQRPRIDRLAVRKLHECTTSGSRTLSDRRT